MTGRTAILVAASLTLTPAATKAQEPPPSPLRVRAQLARPPYYVGQWIPLDVSVIAEGKRPTVTPPRVDGAEITPIGTDMVQLSSSAIGDAVFEQMRYITHYRILPRRVGPLVVPAFAAGLNERRGTSPPVRLTIQKLPEAGRSEAFLGGVGEFEVTAEARPSTVRLGDVLEYSLVVTGPGARGMTRGPAPEKLNRASAALKVEAGQSESVANPPSRRFTYRVRPLRAGDFVLPPVSVASFDPRHNQYETKVSRGVPVHVIEVARFDPRMLDYGSLARPVSWWIRAGIAAAVGVGLVLAVTLVWLALRRSLARRWRDGAPARLLAALSEALSRNESSAAERARTITEGLSEFLRLTIQRPLGALTPHEAREGITRAAGDEDLGAAAGRLISRCDRAQFGSGGPEAEALAGEAKELFANLVRTGGTRGFETPREAAGTVPP